jgi:hypothetical protein
MAANNYYRISALPSLGDLGSPPPLTPVALREHVAEGPRGRALVDSVLLFDDLLQREALVAGEVREVAPAILSPAQVRNEEPLPEYLAPADGPSPPRVASDAVWAAYFRYAHAMAVRRASSFLAAWVEHEVGLRNALAIARAKALGLEPADYLVTPELGRSGEDFSVLVGEWSAAATPLEGLHILDRNRWHWLAENDAWFTFADEELAAYAAKLMLLVRWQRLAKAAEEQAQSKT